MFYFKLSIIFKTGDYVAQCTVQSRGPEAERVSLLCLQSHVTTPCCSLYVASSVAVATVAPEPCFVQLHTVLIKVCVVGLSITFYTGPIT